MPCLRYSLILLTVMASAVRASEEGGGGVGLFSGHFGEALWTVVAFVCLFLVLRKYAWGPLLEGLQAREKHIKDAISGAETSRRKAESLLGEYQVQGEALLKSATEDAQKKAHHLMEHTRHEARAVKEQAQVDIEHARVVAVDRVREQAVDLVAKLTSEVMARAVTPEENDRLIQEALDRLGETPGESGA